MKKSGLMGMDVDSLYKLLFGVLSSRGGRWPPINPTYGVADNSGRHSGASSSWSPCKALFWAVNPGCVCTLLYPSRSVVMLEKNIAG